MTSRTARAGARFLVGFAVPTLLFYALRALGVGLYLALLASAALSAAPSVGPSPVSGVWTGCRRTSPR